MELELKLLKEFLQISTTTRNVFQQSIEAICKTLDCKQCTLWKVNKKAESLSLWAFTGYSPNESDGETFVHRIVGSFSKHMLERDGSNSNFFSIEDITKHPHFDLLKLKRAVVANKCKRCLVILIPTHAEKSAGESSIEAILYLFPKNDIKNKDNLVEIIQKYLSLSFANHYLSRKERLTDSIIKLHEAKGKKDIGSIIHPIINDVLKKFINYEAASAFVWDSSLNRLNLSATTGIVGNPKNKDVFYALGEGLTGQVARDKERRIINFPMDSAPGHLKRFREVKQHSGKSLLYIPIKSVVNGSLLGVLRFINKINPRSKVVDYFSNTDSELLSHISYLIGLYMEFNQSEKLMSSFSKHMSHEILTPAIGMRGLAERLVRKQHSQDFLNKYLADYSRSLFEHSSLQVAQTKTIEHVWRGDRDQPKKIIYNVEEVDLDDVVQSCKKLVFPILRDEGLKFDNIKTSGTFPNIYVDKFAFEPVFLNLLTNCIKYRKRNSTDPFKVEIIGQALANVELPDDEKSKSGYLIKIIDYGLGIPEEEKDNIFLLGFRSKEADKLVARGLGIGLTVVDRVLSDFFCKIWLFSNKNPTEFRIFIPEFLDKIDYTNEEKWTSPPK